jgi:hypothetical protein
MRVPIKQCEAGACAYNRHDHCHAVAVEIGKENAHCESFTRSVMFNVNPHFESQVSSCRMSGCAYNRLSGCTLETVALKDTREGGACRNYVSRTSLIHKEEKKESLKK